jgi:hypothetical protein
VDSLHRSERRNDHSVRMSDQMDRLGEQLIGTQRGLGFKILVGIW